MTKILYLPNRYTENPRPSKEEQESIATEIGHNKRVVQVWFQNARARDRRQGKQVPYFPTMARFRLDAQGQGHSLAQGHGLSQGQGLSLGQEKEGQRSGSETVTTSAVGSCVPAYIPIVPQIFTSSSYKLAR